MSNSILHLIMVIPEVIFFGTLISRNSVKDKKVNKILKTIEYILYGFISGIYIINHMYFEVITFMILSCLLIIGLKIYNKHKKKAGDN